jgi:hypothetical protein
MGAGLTTSSSGILQSRVFDNPVLLAEVVQWLASHAYRLLEIEVAAAATVEAFYEAISSQVPEWPQGYVQGHDAFADGLLDLEGGPIAVVLHGYRSFAARFPGTRSSSWTSLPGRHGGICCWGGHWSRSQNAPMCNSPNSAGGPRCCTPGTSPSPTTPLALRPSRSHQGGEMPRQVRVGQDP